MPVPLYASEKPSASETGHSPPLGETSTTGNSKSSNDLAAAVAPSPSPPTSSSLPSSSQAGSTADRDELSRTTARRSSVNHRVSQEEEAEAEAARLYEERIEEEYAKREGGA